jgi:hypothetical protein
MSTRFFPKLTGTGKQFVAPEDGQGRGHGMLHGRIDGEVVALRVLRLPARRIVIDHHDAVTGERQRRAHAVGAVIETEPSRQVD